MKTDRMLEIAEGYHHCAVQTSGDGDCDLVCCYGKLCPYGKDSWTDEEEVEFWTEIINLLKGDKNEI